jgi:hypothetical protein
VLITALTACAAGGVALRDLPAALGEPASVDYAISPQAFWEEYVRTATVLVLRGAVKDDAAVKLWTWEYLAREFGHLEVRLEPMQEGGEAPEEMPAKTTIRDFHDHWRDAGYIISQTPTPLQNDTTVVPCLACGPVRAGFLEVALFMGAGKTNTKIHKDSNNQMNCLMQGTKIWETFDPVHTAGLYVVQESADTAPHEQTSGYSRIDTTDVDFAQFPKFRKVPFHRVTLQAGDCIYIPGTYLHHVYSPRDAALGDRTSNAQVSMLFNGPDVPTAISKSVRDGEAPWGDTFAHSRDYGFKCPAGGAPPPAPLPMNSVDVQWQHDGVGPITMGFSNVLNYIEEWQMALLRAASKGGGNNQKKPLSKALFVDTVFRATPWVGSCTAARAWFSGGAEQKRFMTDGLRVMYPEGAPEIQKLVAGWTCKGGGGGGGGGEEEEEKEEGGGEEEGMCTIIGLCEHLLEAGRARIGEMYEVLSAASGGRGVMATDFSAKQTRRQIQDRMLFAFALDQCASHFEEVTSDYNAGDDGGGGGGEDGGGEGDDEEDEERREEDDEGDEDRGQRDEL